MKNLKFAVLALAVIGLIGCFLDFVPGLSWFDMRAAEGIGSRVYVLMAGLAIALVGAGIGAATGMKRWNGIVAALGFAGVWVALEFKTFDLFSFAIGAKLIALAAIGGLAAAIVAAVKPEPAT